VTEEHVEVDEVREDEPVTPLAPHRIDPPHAFAFDAVGKDSVTPWPAKMSLIFPTPMTGTPASLIASRTVRGGFIE
jgi:hypothetical protein